MNKRKRIKKKLMNCGKGKSSRNKWGKNRAPDCHIRHASHVLLVCVLLADLFVSIEFATFNPCKWTRE